MNSLFKLLQLSDPALPIGSFAHSAALETYVEQGVVNNGDTALQFIRNMLLNNIRYTDAAFVSLAHDAVENNDLEELILLDEECSAIKSPSETKEASHKLGIRLLRVFAPTLDHGTAGQFASNVFDKKSPGNYSVAFGLIASNLNIEKKDALTGFYYNATVGMITNAVKLIPLGQQQGQALLFSLESLLTELVENSLNPDKERIGLCNAAFDIRAMQHERLYSRLYMS